MDRPLHSGGDTDAASLADNGEKLPYSESAEQAVIGSLLLESSDQIKEQVASMLGGSDFFFEQNRLIFNAFKEIIGSGQKFDAITLQDYLSKREQFESMGGTDYLENLVENTPVIKNLTDYVNIVSEHSRLRKLYSIATSLAKTTLSTEGQSVKDIAEKFEQQLLDLLSGHTAGSMRALKDIIEDLEKSKKQSSYESESIKTGFPDLDSKTMGLHRTDLIILAARPGVGKTSLSINIANHVARHHPAPVIVFSIEMSETMIARRMLSSSEGPPLGRLLNYDRMEAKDWQHFASATNSLKKAAVYIDSSAQQTPLSIKSQLRRIAGQHNHADPALVIIDYLQLMYNDSRTENRNQEIASISRNLKGLAKEFNCPILVLSQLSRPPKGELRSPQLSDLRDSGAIEQDADLVLFLHRTRQQEQEAMNNPGKTSSINLIIGKQRNGPTGVSKLSFDGQHTRFMELDNSYQDTEDMGNPDFTN